MRRTWPPKRSRSAPSAGSGGRSQKRARASPDTTSASKKIASDLAPGIASRTPGRRRSSPARWTAARLASRSDASGKRTSNASSVIARQEARGREDIGPDAGRGSPLRPARAPRTRRPGEIDGNPGEHDRVAGPRVAGVRGEQDPDQDDAGEGKSERQPGIGGSVEGPRPVGTADAQHDHGQDEEDEEDDVHRDDVLEQSAVAAREDEEAGPCCLRPEGVSRNRGAVDAGERREKEPVPRHGEADASAREDQPVDAPER